jgi:hypothetical protein
MRVFTIVNLALWCVLLIALVPYLGLVGPEDRVSTEVLWILVVTACLQGALFALRRLRGRPVFG